MKFENLPIFHEKTHENKIFVEEIDLVRVQIGHF